MSEQSRKLHESMVLCRLAWWRAGRAFHGVVMDPENVALARSARVAGLVTSRTVKGVDERLTAFQRAFQRASHPRAINSAW